MDILCHEIGWSGEFKDKQTGEDILLPFDKVAEILDEKIRLICEDVGATHPPILYITNSGHITQQVNRLRRWQGEPEIKYVPNFRYEVAKTRPYKGNRNNPKPFHFYNIIFYVLGKYDVVLSEGGLEADDMMCIQQRYTYDKVQEGNVTIVPNIICSRDKDLRICPGYHFSWECGKQKAIGPTHTDRIGRLEKSNNKVVGYGLKFFYYQMLVGDTADHIPGLPGWGSVKAFKLLDTLNTEKELYKAVKSKYIEVVESPKEYFLEQANLLWMIQEKGKSFELYQE